jgi:predicted membrane-bound mannosyltransferase
VTTDEDAVTANGDGGVRPWWARWLRRLRRSEDGGSRITSLALLPWELPGYGVLIGTAAAMRLWDLGARAMHHDESLHALYSWNLSEGKGYVHDPMMHGPLQMEITAAVFYVLGDGEFTARLLYAVAGTTLVALPFFLRYRLGRIGALLVAGMLAVSPTMLYFSRFARNDILMAVWALGLVIAMWRYLDDGRDRNLYFASCLLALAFATKETAYIVTGTLGLFLLILALARNWGSIRRGVVIGEVSPPAAVARIIKGAWEAIPLGTRLRGISRPAGFFVLLFTLALPIGAALVSIFQDTALLSWSNLVLASPIDGTGPIGTPIGGGIVVAVLVVVGLLIVSAIIGIRWNGWLWVRCAAVFYAIWVPLYSTFFTNLEGVPSGAWRSLGYWIAQQAEGRGNQPTYYYTILTPLYEFLPLIFAVAGAVYYLRRNDLFGTFLVFWAGITFLLYTAASEKMPWLLVNITLPLIVLGGRFLGDMVDRIEWRRLVAGGGLFLMAGVPILVLLLYALIFLDVALDDPTSLMLLAASVGTLTAMVVSGYVITKSVGYRSFFAFATIPLAVLLLMLTVRTTWNASYENGDIPVEMLVYTQTSPDISALYEYVSKAGYELGEDSNLQIVVDDTSGFSWPWAWYLRDYTTVSYNSFGGSVLPHYTSLSQVLVVHRDNQSKTDAELGDVFGDGTLIRHRWWFPEYKYRGLTLGTLLKGLVDREAWRAGIEYFLDRDVVFDDIGSEDAYVYFRDGFPGDFVP